MTREKVLSWGDFVLTTADLASLSGANWLNDQVISFYLSYLLQSFSLDDVLAVDCSVCFLASQVGLDAAAIIADLHPGKRRFIVAPVNDNPDAQVAHGGSHWTLLLAHRPDTDAGTPFQFLHCDSAGGGAGTGSFRAAAVLARVLAQAAGQDPRAAEVAPLAYMPRQVNCYDCGAYVLAAAELVHEHARAGGVGAPSAEQFSKSVTPGTVTALRKKILDVIHELAAEAVAAARNK